jgi:hypothetical protein
VSPVEQFTEEAAARSGVRIRYLDNSPDEADGHGGRLPILFSPGVADCADEQSDAQWASLNALRTTPPMLLTGLDNRAI